LGGGLWGVGWGVLGGVGNRKGNMEDGYAQALKGPVVEKRLIRQGGNGGQYRHRQSNQTPGEIKRQAKDDSSRKFKKGVRGAADPRKVRTSSAVN